jgi:(p)ppGpp synthase/HD superfamily hydrolase
MALTGDERARLLKATELALDWHTDQYRKGTDIPYWSHLAQVQGLVLEHGGDVDQAIAALLHDSLEDADSSADRADRERIIAHEFGADVLRIVLDCTDTGPDESAEDKKPWKERKQRYVDGLAKKSDRSLLVAACDKRHNLHALVWDIRSQGPGYLDKFNAGAEDQIWYFSELIGAFDTALAHVEHHRRLVGELRSLLGEFESLVRES